jgi:2-keto-4-pentenoate hydratase
MRTLTAVRAAAAALLSAYEHGTPSEPITELWPALTLGDAYRVQLLQVEHWRRQGRTVRGLKVGLTSAAMQRMLGVSEPDFGHVLDHMLIGEHETVQVGRFLQPRIEPEVAFVLGRSLKGPGVTAADVLVATAFVVPCLEIIDSRISEWRIGLIDTVADNASSGGVVLGARAVAPAAIDLSRLGCNLWVNGAIAQTGASGAVMGNPVHAVVWLANTLGALGTTLEEGHVVLAGSCTAAVPVSPGDTVMTTFSTLGSVTIRFDREA